MAKHTSSDEFDGATPVPSPINPPAPAQKKARARKAELSASAASPQAEAAPDYAALGLDGDKARQAESLRLESLELGRKSTGTVFEWGRIAASLHGLADDQKHFAKLAKGVLKLSRTGAENYKRVHDHLVPYRDRLVRVGMIASGLYELATAEPEQIEEALAVREGGQELTLAQIKAMVGKGDTPVTSPDEGGIAGLKARIAEKTAIGVAELIGNVEELFEAVLVALEPHRQGKRIVVKDIQRPFIHPSRLIREQLQWLTWRAVPAPDGFGEGAIHHDPLNSEDGWYKLDNMLESLGGYEKWPAAAEVGAWLTDTVVPQLAWLLGDRANKGFAVIDKLAAAAEAERVKAEKARERAKAEQKKARQKAKLDKAKAQKAALREAKTAAKLSAVMGSVMADVAGSSPSSAKEA